MTTRLRFNDYAHEYAHDYTHRYDPTTTLQRLLHLGNYASRLLRFKLHSSLRFQVRFSDCKIRFDN